MKIQNDRHLFIFYFTSNPSTHYRSGNHKEHSGENHLVFFINMNFILLTDGVTDAGQNVMTKAHLQNEGELKMVRTNLESRSNLLLVARF